MNYLNFTIQLNREEYDNFEKLSHPQKTLKSHIIEVISVGKELLRKYEFSGNYWKAFEYLAFTHDLGKLSKEWNINNKKNPSHSDESIRIILKKIKFDNSSQKEGYLFQERKNWQAILLFFVLKHHGILKKNSFEVRKIELDLDFLLKREVKELSFVEKINLTDIFGIFKIADLISANSVKEEDINRNISRILRKVKIDIDNVKSNLHNLDSKRWEQQKKILELKGVSLLRAPTGWGKTSVSLLYSVNNKSDRIFYILPTITAIRDFKIKLQRLAGKENVETFFYFYDVEKYMEGALNLEEMFYAQNFLRPIIITTIDQFLLTFLQTNKYFLRRFNFRKSLVILDEVHLLSPLMLNLFIYFFNKFREIYNFKLLLMSATLSNGLVEFLKERLQIENRNFLDFLVGLRDKLRVKFYYNHKTDIRESIEEIINKLNAGKRVLVIVNTVDKAIELGRKIEEIYDPDKDTLIIFHSRFLYKDRIKKESEILGRMKNTPHILISTQISEVSLDISYDYLFTELSPFASLIQRFGRVNRYGNVTKGINVEIFYPTEVDSSKYYPYEKEELNISHQILSFFENKNLRNEFEIYEKLDEVLTKEKIEKMVEDTKTNLSIKSWESVLDFFYSFSMDEDSIRKILEYRENFSTLTLISPDMIENSETRLEYEKLLEKLLGLANKSLTIKDKQTAFVGIKQFTISVPFWIAKNCRIDKGFPLLELKNYRYNSHYGLYELTKKDFII